MNAYPLQWPPGIKRTKSHRRLYGTFSRGGKRLSMSTAIDRLMSEVGRYGLRIPRGTVVVNSDVKVRKPDGMPYAAQRDPDDPGVAIYFRFDGDQKCMSCDKFIRMPDNIAGVASALASIRTIERHANEGLISAIFTGFKALPDLTTDNWRAVLGLSDMNVVTPRAIEHAYRVLAKWNHPDRDGSHEQMAKINAARDRAMKECVQN